jgi:hypothetical protein
MRIYCAFFIVLLKQFFCCNGWYQHRGGIETGPVKIGPFLSCTGRSGIWIERSVVQWCVIVRTPYIGFIPWHLTAPACISRARVPPLALCLPFCLLYHAHNAFTMAPFGLWYAVDGGHRAVIWHRFAGGIQDVVYGEGTHFRIPGVTYPTLFDVRMKPRVHMTRYVISQR